MIKIFGNKSNLNLKKISESAYLITKKINETKNLFFNRDKNKGTKC